MTAGHVLKICQPERLAGDRFGAVCKQRPRLFAGLVEFCLSHIAIVQLIDFPQQRRFDFLDGPPITHRRID